MTKNNEIYAEVVSRGQTMRGMVHRPVDFSPSRRYPAIMMWHGFTGTRVEPHRLFVKTARRLAREGFIVARFDFIGSGESDGEFVEMTPESEIADALAVVNWITGQPGVDRTKLGLIGLSLGGFVSAATAARSGQIAALCLWAATANIWKSLLPRVTPEAEVFLAKHGWVDWQGNAVGQAFFDSARSMDVPKELQSYHGAALILHGDADPTVTLDHAETYQRAMPQATLRIVKNADHTFNRADWEAELIENTTQWLKTTL